MQQIKGELRLRVAAIVLLSLMGVALVAWLGVVVGDAKSQAAAISGSVEDGNGGRLPGAGVSAVNEATGTRAQAVSNGEGEFQLLALPVGRYRIEVTLNGFGKKVFTGVQADAVSPVNLKVVLTPSTVAEIVNISSEGQLLQTENSTQAATLTAKELTELPTASRNVTHLIVAEPGVSAPLPDRTGAGLNIATTPGAQVEDSAQSLNPSINGARPTNNSLRLNGVDGTNLLNRSGGLGNNLIVPLDSLEVVSVQSALYNSPTGRNGGGNIELVTRTGTNQFHGTAAHFLQNEKFNANAFFLNRNGNVRPKFRRNETSAAFGGPIIKDKLFFFASVQRTEFLSGYASNATARVGLPVGLTDVRTRETIAQVANDYLRNGQADNAGFAANFLTRLRAFPAEQQAGLFQKFFGTATPNANSLQFRTLTPADIHPVAVNILNAKRNGQFLIPTPASSLAVLPGNGAFGREQFLQQVVPTEVDSWAGVGSLQWTPREKDRFRLNYNNSNSNVLEAFGWADASPSPTDGQTKGWSTSLSHQHTFSARFVNDLRLGFFDLSNNRLSRYKDIKNSTLGIYNPLEQLGGLAALMPTIDITTQFSSGGIGNAWDFYDRQKVYNIVNTLSYVRERHAFQFGGEYRRMNLTGEFQSRTNGDLDYDTWALFFTGHGAAGGGSDLDQGDTRRNMTAQDISWYAHDDWKVRKGLTLNLGMRYDFFGNFTDSDGRLGTFITEALARETGLPVGFQVPANSQIFKQGFKPLDIGLYVEPGTPIDLRMINKAKTDSSLFNDANNFAPRVGFAWQPRFLPKFVLRGGYSIFYERTSASYKVDLQRAAPFFIYQNVPAPVDMANPYPRLNINPFQLPFNVAIARNANGTPRWIRGDGKDFPASEPFGAKSNVYIHPNIKAPYMQQWSLNTQYEVMRGVALDLRYVGSRGVGLVGRFNVAQAVDPRVTPVNGFTDIRDRNRSTTNPDGALINPDFFVPSQFLGLSRAGGFVQVANVGHSIYHSLQVDVKGRMSRRAIWNVAYTFSKSIDNLSSDTTQAQHDNTRLFLNRGLSDFDRPHRLNASFVVDLPGMKSGQPFFNALTNGWRFSGLLTLQSGSPFTILGAAARNAYQYQVSSVRPSLAPGRTIESAIKDGRVQDRLGFGTTDQYFDPTAFINSEDQWGNVGRNTLRGPNQQQMDISVSKTTKLRESLGLEFRWEMFNFTNTPSFGNPSSTLAGGGACLPSPSRQCAPGTTTAYGTIGRISSTIGGPRTMQGSVRLTF
ncbi:MAG: carboxypeptidase regulatory-like domain-containing protein [Blastocatellia bacterium]|nr:carboxypeptidase regulatory-like domain-containing protein [Blastocatellia bacterium]